MSTLDPRPGTFDEVLLEVMLRLADDRLVLGQRVSEWCGHAPELEEDLALANIALDLIGAASALYACAARVQERLNGAAGVEVERMDDDHFAYFRDDIDFRNLQICELPIGDFAFTIGRQFLFSVHSMLVLEAMASTSETASTMASASAVAPPSDGHAPSDGGSAADLAGICAKHLKEVRYHVRHSREWVVRLGDGTQESRRRMQAAIDDLWMYTGELFVMDDSDRKALDAGLWPDMDLLKPSWDGIVKDTLAEAGLVAPAPGYMASGGRSGFHTEHLGPLLAQMQFLRRSHPDASWS